MRFEYEVEIDEYVSGSLAYWKLIGGRTRSERGFFGSLAGVAVIGIAWAGDPVLRSVVLTAVAALWIYEGGLKNFFPQSYLSRYYALADLNRRKFTAEISEQCFEVTTESWSWRVPWQGIRFKAEDERVFMVYSFGTMFIFGKKYLGPEQQREIRRRLGM